MDNKFFDLTGKTALITGASSGLGQRFAQILALNGAKVIICARRNEKLVLLAQEIKNRGGHALPIRMDVTLKEDVEKVIHQLTLQGERIDILINDAGVASPTPIFESDAEEEFEQQFKTNTIGLWYVTKAVVHHMKQNSISGSIINISSINGANRLGEGFAGYCASKAGVIQLTKALVGELAKAHIRINCILPGVFATPMTTHRIEDPIKRNELEKLIPVGFIAEPQDLDGTILLLASNAASRYITGAAFTVDGGISWGG